MLNCLDAGWASFRSHIWGYRYIIGDSQMLNGNTSRRECKKRLSSWKGKLLSLGGRLVLINSVLSNMVLYMISFFQLPKGVLIDWIIFDQDSFGKEIARERNIDWLNGVWFAVPKTKEGWAFMTLRLRIGPSSANGCSNY